MTTEIRSSGALGEPCRSCGLGPATCQSLRGAWWCSDCWIAFKVMYVMTRSTDIPTAERMYQEAVREA